MNSVHQTKPAIKGQVVSLDFNGATVQRDTRGLVSLTDMWRAAGEDSNKKPVIWLRSQQASDLIDVLKVTNPHLLKTKSGKGGGTWGNQSIAIAYAKFLSPEFHAWALKVVIERIEEEQNPELGITRAQERAVKSWTRSGKTSSWIGVRIEGISTRNEFTAICAKRGGKDFRSITNAIYLGIYNKSAKALREKHELRTGANIRDAMGETALIMVRLAENLAGKKAEGENLYGDAELSKAAHHCARSVHDAVRGALKGAA